MGNYGAALRPQALLAIGIHRHLRMQQLDRDVAFESWVPRLEHFTHAAGPHSRDDSIRSDSLALLGGGHLGRRKRPRRGGWKPSMSQMSERALASEVRKP